MKNIILAIETAVGNGSLALFEDRKLIDELTGRDKIARSDAFLPILERFLEKNETKKKDLKKIAVSCGPGSFTGARVGVATALALKHGLGIPCFGVSVLQAMALSVTTTNEKTKIVSAFLNDKNQVIWQIATNDLSINFKNSDQPVKKASSNDINMHSTEDFATEINSIKSEYEGEIKLVLEKTLFESLPSKITENNKSENISLIDAGKNLSFYIGQAINSNNKLKSASDNPAIIYLN